MEYTTGKEYSLVLLEIKYLEYLFKEEKIVEQDLFMGELQLTRGVHGDYKKQGSNKRLTIPLAKQLELLHESYLKKYGLPASISDLIQKTPIKDEATELQALRKENEFLKDNIRFLKSSEESKKELIELLKRDIKELEEKVLKKKQ